MTGPPLSTVKDDKMTIFKFHNCCGLNSNLMNMLAYKIYYNDLGRSFVVDEHGFNYGGRMLSKYFLPTFPVIHDKQTSETYSEQYERLYKDDDIRNPKADFTVLSFMDFGNAMRTEVKRKIEPRGVEGYKRMAKEACDNLRFSGYAKNSMNAIKRQRRIPNFDRRITAGFHIRRGDKIGLESERYDASSYVEKLLHAMSANQKIEYCFVATDDYQVVEELQAAIDEYQVGCTLYSLVNPNQKGNQQGKDMVQKVANNREVLQFLTEMSILMEVSYFIGTFNSNVGSVVSLLRSCRWNRNEEINYHHSYGVDQNHFRMM